MSDANRKIEESRAALRAIARDLIAEGGKVYRREAEHATPPVPASVVRQPSEPARKSESGPTHIQADANR